MNLSEKQALDGVLLTSKPKGWTSFDVVRRIKSLVRPVKVGHTGTLDPMATGLLPLILGEATKLSRWLSGDAKRYRARVRLGVATDTLDADVERRVRQVEIFALELLRLGSDFLELDVTCSAGTYIRSLAHDIGDGLGTKAHLAALQRTEACGFLLESAVAVLDLDRAGVVERMLDLEQVLMRFTRIDVPVEIAMRLAQGSRLEEADLALLDVELARDERIVWFRPPQAAPIVLARLMPSGSSPSVKILRVLRRPDPGREKH